MKRKTLVVSAEDPAAITEAAKIIREGGLVAIPTETVYGLGADASNPIAVAKIFDTKQRPSIDPLIVHVADIKTATLLGEFPDPTAFTLMNRFWPGPLTLVVRKTPLVPLIVTAGLGSVALRIPAHPAALALIRESGCAIAAPSANLFGYVSPTEAQHVLDQLGDKIDLVLDGGPCVVGVESTIVSLVGPRPRLLRAGGVTPEELETLVGPLEGVRDSPSRPTAPGQMTRHYATRTRLLILDQCQTEKLPSPCERMGLLTLTPCPDENRFAAVEVLSKTGDLREAAANLFAALRRLDGLRLDGLVAHPVPEKGLGIAIMDRLRRCAAGSA